MQKNQSIPYQPENLPPKSLDAGVLLHPTVKASAELARYDELLSNLKNPNISNISSISNIIIFLLLNEEATLSSQIEGTQATFDEILRHDAGIEDITQTKKRDDIQEIFNYRDALEDGQKSLDSGYKLSMHLVRGLHKTLMESVRGKDKSPGEVRLTQNHIGHPYSDIKDAFFVPPSPEQLPVHLDNWIAYIENNKQEVLIQSAIMHAQFELLHPFKDGNGRLGRILIPLFLYQKKIISKPAFYISAYLESNRDEYYRRLQNISKKNDWTGWVLFFLRAVVAQCKTNNEKIRKVVALHESTQEKVRRITRSQFTPHILKTIFTNPYCSIADFIKNGVTTPSAYLLIRKLEQSKILTSVRPSSGRRTAIYAFVPLLKIIIAPKNR